MNVVQNTAKSSSLSNTVESLSSSSSSSTTTITTTLQTSEMANNNNNSSNNSDNNNNNNNTNSSNSNANISTTTTTTNATTLATSSSSTNTSISTTTATNNVINNVISSGGNNNNNNNNTNNNNGGGGNNNNNIVGQQPSVTLTIRLIMQGKEVGSIIGKKGDNIKKFREESGAKITISDGSCPERIVTVTGSTESILKAFAMIARKFEEDANNSNSMNINHNISNAMTTAASQSSSSSSATTTTSSSTTSTHGQNGKQNSITMPVTLKLIVPASQCGSLIGKGGSKIKEIREITGASIQVASEMLPNSTERAVTLSGSADSITKSIYQICCVMLESPAKGPTIPYRPRPSMPPVFFAGGQAYTIQGQFAIPHPDLTKLHRLALQHAPLLPGQAVGSLNPQATLASLAANTTASLGHHGNTAATNPGMVPTLTTEMTISNDIIGSVIGKGGSKINEIRQLSGATIKINSSEEGVKDRTITISGTPEAINLAQYLIATRIYYSTQQQQFTSTKLSSNNTTTTSTTRTLSSAAATAASTSSSSIILDGKTINIESKTTSTSSPASSITTINSSINYHHSPNSSYHHFNHHQHHNHPIYNQCNLQIQLSKHHQQQQQQHAYSIIPYTTTTPSSSSSSPPTTTAAAALNGMNTPYFFQQQQHHHNGYSLYSAHNSSPHHHHHSHHQYPINLNTLPLSSAATTKMSTPSTFNDSMKRKYPISQRNKSVTTTTSSSTSSTTVTVSSTTKSTTTMAK